MIGKIAIFVLCLAYGGAQAGGGGLVATGGARAGYLAQTSGAPARTAGRPSRLVVDWGRRVLDRHFLAIAPDEEAVWVQSYRVVEFGREAQRVLDDRARPAMDDPEPLA